VLAIKAKPTVNEPLYLNWLGNYEHLSLQHSNKLNFTDTGMIADLFEGKQKLRFMLDM